MQEGSTMDVAERPYTPTVQLCPPLAPGTKYYDPQDSAFELLDAPKITHITPRKSAILGE